MKKLQQEKLHLFAICVRLMCVNPMDEVNAMKKRLLAALLALTLLLTACQYAVVEDETDVVMGLPGSAAIGEEAPDSEPLARGSRDQDGETAVQALQ